MIWSLAAGLGLALSGCGAVRAVKEAPAAAGRAITGTEKPPAPAPLSELHMVVLRQGDAISDRVRAATDRFATAAGTPEAQVQAVRWRLEASRTAFEQATGPVPTASMLDMLLYSTAARVAHERYWMPEVWGEADRPMLEAFQALEADAIAILKRYFDSEQAERVQELVSQWVEDEFIPRKDALASLPAFTDLATAFENRKQSGGLFGFIRLDPYAGLEPVAREVALTRQFGERMLYWTERLPLLLDDQVELALLEARRQPEVMQVLANVDRVSRAAEELSATAAALPDQVSAEREAALKQVAEELTAQREGLVRDLQQVEEPAHTLLSDSTATLAAAERMSTATTELVREVDAFMARIEAMSPDEPEPAEPGRPFDITEYGDTADRLAAASVELRGLVAETGANLERVDAMVDTSLVRGEEAVDRVLRGVLVVGLLLIAAAGVTALLVRRLSRPR